MPNQTHEFNKDGVRMNRTDRTDVDGSPVPQNLKDADRLENDANGDTIPTAEHANEVRKDAEDDRSKGHTVEPK